jgi:hypothetical protein
MSTHLKEILQRKIKPKEKVNMLCEWLENDKERISEVIEILQSGTNVERGTCAEFLKHMAKSNPEIVIPFLDTLIKYINYDASRVKWGIPESIGFLAQNYPDDVRKAIPNLLINTKEESTVIRWCAAFALTEIAKFSTASREDLIPIFIQFVKTEQNNGVKNVYQKALQFIENE